MGFAVFRVPKRSLKAVDPGWSEADEWGVKSQVPETPRRTRRARAVAWSAAGLSSALLLIGGSLAALDREVLRGGSWHSYDERGGKAIVLAPEQQRVREIVE